MAQQPHLSGMRRADWLSWPFSSIHPLSTDLDGDAYAQILATFVSNRRPIGPRAAMALPNFEDSDWDSASQESDATVVPILFNTENVMTSDVIVRFDGGRREFLSEKRILSAMSSYFKRAFSGNFSVATSDVIDLGDEDNAKRICAMLCFIHGTPYTRLHQRNAVGHNLDFHIDLYLLGEQFDIRTLRYAAATTFFKEAVFFIDTPWFPMAVQRVIGPDAPVMADQYLVEVTVKICIEHIEKLITNERFVEMAHAGELADDEMMVKLYLALGQRVRDMSGNEARQSNEDLLLEAQVNMLIAEAAMGPGPYERSTLGGQVMATRARNAAWAAQTNLAVLAPQPTWAPPPAILASQPPPAAAAAAATSLAANPPPVGHPVVARIKTGFTKTVRTKASLLNKALFSRLKKT